MSAPMYVAVDTCRSTVPARSIRPLVCVADPVELSCSVRVGLAKKQVTSYMRKYIQVLIRMVKIPMISSERHSEDPDLARVPLTE